MKLRLLLIGCMLTATFSQALHSKTVRESIDESLELYENKRYDDAITLALSVTAKNPNHIKANWLCSVSYFSIEFYSEALRYYRRFVELENEAYAYSNLGGILGKLGYIDEAIKNYDRAIEMYPDYRTPILNKASVLSMAYRTDEAFVYYAQALEIDALDAATHNNMAITYLRLKDYDKARHHLDVALKQAEDPRRYYQFSEELKKKQDPNYKYSKSALEAGIDFYTAGITANRYDSYYTYRRGDCYTKLGEKQLAEKDYLLALDLLNEVIADMPTAWTQINNRGDVYKDLGRKEEALRDYRRVLQLNPLAKGAQENIEKLTK